MGSQGLLCHLAFLSRNSIILAALPRQQEVTLARPQTLERPSRGSTRQAGLAPVMTHAGA